MKLVIFSDSHCTHEDLDIPDGDWLIFAGDMCSYGDRKEAKRFIKWMEELPHKVKIAICGNHDWPFYKDSEYGKKFKTVHYLQDSSVTINGIKVYGSPWQPKFCNWAFNLSRGEELKAKWDMIPKDTDILITHCPPAETFDYSGGMPLGCVDLKEAVERIEPKVHIFGHIHRQHGVKSKNGITYVNGSIVDDYNFKINDPIVLDYGKDTYYG